MVPQEVSFNLIQNVKVKLMRDADQRRKRGKREFDKHGKALKELNYLSN